MNPKLNEDGQRMLNELLIAGFTRVWSKKGNHTQWYRPDGTVLHAWVRPVQGIRYAHQYMTR